MIGKIRLVFDKKEHRLEIHQEGVDIDGMAIGRIHNVAEVEDERETAPYISRYNTMIYAYDECGEQIACFWCNDIESLEVKE